MSIRELKDVGGKTVCIDLPTPITPESLSELIVAIQQISLLKYDKFDGAIIEFSTKSYIEMDQYGYIILKENGLDGSVEKDLDLLVRFNYVDESISLEDLLKQTFNNHWDEIYPLIPHIKERIQFEYL